MVEFHDAPDEGMEVDKGMEVCIVLMMGIFFSCEISGTNPIRRRTGASVFYESFQINDISQANGFLVLF